MMASSLLPSTLAMYFMSAKPNLRRDDASASLVVDMFKSSVAGYAVLSVRIGAFSAVLSLPFVPALYFCSRARSLPAIGEPEIWRTLVLSLIYPYFLTNESYCLLSFSRALERAASETSGSTCFASTSFSESLNSLSAPTLACALFANGFSFRSPLSSITTCPHCPSFPLMMSPTFCPSSASASSFTWEGVLILTGSRGTYTFSGSRAIASPSFLSVSALLDVWNSTFLLPYLSRTNTGSPIMFSGLSS